MARGKKQQAGFFVLQPFKDAKQFGTAKYEAGDDVSEFDADRLNNLVKRGLVEERGASEEKED